MNAKSQDTSNYTALSLKREALRGKKKSLRALLVDFDESFDEDEEQLNMALMADVHSNSNSEFVNEEIEVLSNFSRSELLIMLNENLKKKSQYFLKIQKPHKSPP